MLIDINANIGHWPFIRTDCKTCGALLERMNQFGVDLSVISNMNGIFYKNSQPANEEMHKELMSDRRFRIESLRPSEADASVMELLRSGNAKRILDI